MKDERPYQDLQRFQLPANFRGRSAFIVQLWWLVQFFLIRPSPQFMYAWRRFWLRLFGAKIGARVLIRPSAQITFPWKVVIGENSWIGDEVVLYSLAQIEIGANTVISQRSYICTGTHDYRQPSFDISAEPISIGNQVWIAGDVFVAPGITVGDGTVVGLRSTVLHNLPPGMICYGNPAKPVKPRHVTATVTE